MTEYKIEIWNNKKKKYEHLTTMTGVEFARRLVNKTYLIHNTRRIIKIDKEIIYQEKAGKIKVAKIIRDKFDSDKKD